MLLFYGEGLLVPQLVCYLWHLSQYICSCLL